MKDDRAASESPTWHRSDAADKPAHPQFLTPRPSEP